MGNERKSNHEQDPGSAGQLLERSQTNAKKILILKNRTGWDRILSKQQTGRMMGRRML